MSKLKVMVISSVLPKATSGGEIVLYRHLCGETALETEIIESEPERLALASRLHRLAGRLGKTRLSRFANDFVGLSAGSWLDGNLPQRINLNGSKNTVVLTVAHGESSLIALRFAREFKLPLVTFFHDWWPDIPDVHAPVRRRLEANFKRVYQGSAASLCVCKGMQAALGTHPCAPVLYPIPQVIPARAGPISAACGNQPFKIYYSGNLFDYGPMLGEALKALADHRNIRLEVRGADPNWSAEFRETMRARGLWRTFAPREELQQWLSEADAFLIPMVFDARSRRRMETSFPSKLIEFAHWGKPLVVWGPEYCSAIKWSGAEKRALCVTTTGPSSLIQALEGLSAAPAEQHRLGAAALLAAKGEFDPARIQHQFLNVLRQVAATRAD